MYQMCEWVMFGLVVIGSFVLSYLLDRFVWYNYGISIIIGLVLGMIGILVPFDYDFTVYNYVLADAGMGFNIYGILIMSREAILFRNDYDGTVYVLLSSGEVRELRGSREEIPCAIKGLAIPIHGEVVYKVPEGSKVVVDKQGIVRVYALCFDGGRCRGWITRVEAEHMGLLDDDGWNELFKVVKKDL